jgi:hypothetical protein
LRRRRFLRADADAVVGRQRIRSFDAHASTRRCLGVPAALGVALGTRSRRCRLGRVYYDDRQSARWVASSNSEFQRVVNAFSFISAVEHHRVIVHDN